MTKEDLKHGNVVETRDGDKYIFNYVEGKSYFIRLDGAGFNPSKYYKYDLCIDDSNRESDIVKVYKDYTLKELLWKRKEPIKLTDDEITILRNIDEEFKYIARDSNGLLYIYKNKPDKTYDLCWGNGRGTCFCFNHLFQFIKWEDEEPYLIEDLLEEQEDDDNNRE